MNLPERLQWQNPVTFDEKLDIAIERMISSIGRIKPMACADSTARAAGHKERPATVPPYIILGPGDDYVRHYTPQACMGFVEWVRGLIRRLKR